MFDLGYVNVQLGHEGMDGVYKLSETPSKPLPPSQALEVSDFDTLPIDAWHKDQTPVVLVLMLSDTSTMRGGETAVKIGNDKIINAAGANIGAGVMMAGAYLEPAALRVMNCSERVSMVNSYCYADPDADDSGTTLGSVHCSYDSHAEIRGRFMGMKIERLRGRCENMIEKVEKKRAKGVDLDRREVEGWVLEQVKFLRDGVGIV